MKPFKSGKGTANWLLRIALVASLYFLYSNILSTWTFTNPSFLVALSAAILGILVFLGGVFSKPGLTIVAGLAIALLSIYKIAISFNGAIDHYLVAHFFPLAVGFYFFSNGNDN
jgi:hypothetical protein